jgi:hypothetical protein
MNEHDTTIYKKANFYKDRDIPIHITKKNGMFHNGKILEINGEFLILDDKVLGAMPIYFIEIKDMERYNDGHKSL